MKIFQICINFTLFQFFAYNCLNIGLILFLLISSLPKSMIAVLLSTKPFLYDILMMSYDKSQNFAVGRLARNSRAACARAKNFLKSF